MLLEHRGLSIIFPLQMRLNRCTITLRKRFVVSTKLSRILDSPSLEDMSKRKNQADQEDPDSDSEDV
jgi:hypothetical protein